MVGGPTEVKNLSRGKLSQSLLPASPKRLLPKIGGAISGHEVIQSLSVWRISKPSQETGDDECF